MIVKLRRTIAKHLRAAGFGVESHDDRLTIYDAPVKIADYKRTTVCYIEIQKGSPIVVFSYQWHGTRTKCALEDPDFLQNVARAVAIEIGRYRARMQPELAKLKHLLAIQLQLDAQQNEILTRFNITNAEVTGEACDEDECE